MGHRTLQPMRAIAVLAGRSFNAQPEGAGCKIEAGAFRLGVKQA
jgi:hypothetical protein